VKTKRHEISQSLNHIRPRYFIVLICDVTFILFHLVGLRFDTPFIIRILIDWLATNCWPTDSRNLKITGMATCRVCHPATHLVLSNTLPDCFVDMSVYATPCHRSSGLC